MPQRHPARLALTTLATLLAALSGVARARAVTFYSSRPGFNAASAGLNTISFEGIAGTGRAVSVPQGVTLQGVNFSDVLGNLIIAGPIEYTASSVLASNGATDLIITPPSGTRALGLDFALAGDPAARPVQFVLASGQTFFTASAGSGPLSVQFFGVTSAAPLQSIQIISTNPTSTLVVDNVAFGQTAVPEPCPLALLGLGLLPLGAVAARRRAA